MEGKEEEKFLIREGIEKKKHQNKERE